MEVTRTGYSVLVAANVSRKRSSMRSTQFSNLTSRNFLQPVVLYVQLYDRYTLVLDQAVVVLVPWYNSTTLRAYDLPRVRTENLSGLPSAGRRA